MTLSARCISPCSMESFIATCKESFKKERDVIHSYLLFLASSSAHSMFTIYDINNISALCLYIYV